MKWMWIFFFQCNFAQSAAGPIIAYLFSSWNEILKHLNPKLSFHPEKIKIKYNSVAHLYIIQWNVADDFRFFYIKKCFLCTLSLNKVCQLKRRKWSILMQMFLSFISYLIWVTFNSRQTDGKHDSIAVLNTFKNIYNKNFILVTLGRISYRLQYDQQHQQSHTHLRSLKCSVRVIALSQRTKHNSQPLKIHYKKITA